MKKILIVDDRDAELFKDLLRKDALEGRVCASGVKAMDLLAQAESSEFAAAIVLWEIGGPPFGGDVLARCREMHADMPVIVVTGMLDATLATRAFVLGAKDFLEKPLDGDRVRLSLRRLLAPAGPLLPLVDKMRQTILGEAPSLLEALSQLAKATPHRETRVLLCGETGTGKELLARALHGLGPDADKPWVPVNVGAIAKDLVESALFGHEKGAFTGATALHQGFLEEAADGTLFLDEIGDLDYPLQVKLLRVIQEKEFRRIKGTESRPFRARLVCATHRDLAQDVQNSRFRRDLYHRIAEVIIRIPPLRERRDDIDLFLDHVLEIHTEDSPCQFARETRTILRSYPFYGNVRELENIIKAAVIQSDGNTILPHHLPLEDMAPFLEEKAEDISEEPIFNWPEKWLDEPHVKARQKVTQEAQQAFDRLRLPAIWAQSGYTLTKAAAIAGVDKNTFKSRWEKCGLPPLGSRKEKANG